jgi:hypothetical protein
VADTDTTGAAPAGSPASSSPGFDRAAFDAELAAARQEAATYRQTLEALRPYEDDLNWLLEKPDNVEFVRESRRAYESARQAREQTSPELKPIVEDLREIKAFTNDLKAAQERAKQEPFLKWQRDGEQYLLGKVNEDPELKPHLNRIAAQLGTLCRPAEYGGLGMTFDEGWKELTEPSFVKKQNSAPPPSMRGDAGMPGLPPASRPAPLPSGDGSGKKLSALILERMAASG